MVLAIGIVVDDAIVVVKRSVTSTWAGRRLRRRGAMEEAPGPIIAIALVLCAVFVPTAFVSGLTGRFYQRSL
jgi:multidrug efflux pump